MKNKDAKIGTIISLNLPQIACQLPAMDFDFIFIDLEHGHVSDETITAIILSKKPDCKIFIRMREITEACIKHALDIGCDGIIAPRVEHLHEIDTLLSYAFYPPAGKRSVGFSLANRYGLDFKNYTENFRPIILPQIESVQGLAIAEQILSNKQITGIFVGPYDLSMSLGVAGQFDAPVFKESYEALRHLCKVHDKLFCTFTSGIEQAREEVLQGTDLIAVGVDANLFLKQYQQMMNSVRGV
jgi:2-keto-3-deoxy-L-rhamnonate aldolase RhmA